jgi:hypothetical protein
MLTLENGLNSQGCRHVRGFVFYYLLTLLCTSTSTSTLKPQSSPPLHSPQQVLCK